MSFRDNLRRGRSHLIIAAVLLVAGSIVVQIEDRHLSREIGKPMPQRRLGVPIKSVKPAAAGVAARPSANLATARPKP